MPYSVKFEPDGRALAIDQAPQGFDLEGALAHAHELLFTGHVGVTIQDGQGHSISGDDLAHCCNGDKVLTADLRAEKAPET